MGDFSDINLENSKSHPGASFTHLASRKFRLLMKTSLSSSLVVFGNFRSHERNKMSLNFKLIKTKQNNVNNVGNCTRNESKSN